MSTRIYFVRHGESESNLIHQFAGSLDTPLTVRGREQAKATANFLNDAPFSAVYSSDLSRAHHTGLLIAESHHIPITCDPQLREVFAGEWEGKSYDQLEREYPDSYGVWRNHIGLAKCPKGESVAQLQTRVSTCIDAILRQHPNQSICITTHATPIRVMECIWRRIPLSEMHTIPWVSNASVTIVEWNEDGEWRLLERDLHDHLGNLHTKLAKNV